MAHSDGRPYEDSFFYQLTEDINSRTLPNAWFDISVRTFLMSYFRPKQRTLNVNKDTHSAKRGRSQQHHILKDRHLSVVNRGQSNVLSVIKSAPSYSTVCACVQEGARCVVGRPRIERLQFRRPTRGGLRNIKSRRDIELRQNSTGQTDGRTDRQTERHDPLRLA